jgi:RimJ/RimL family protein N-acetyltransferase
MGRMLPLAITRAAHASAEAAMIGHVFLQYIDWQAKTADLIVGIHPDHWGRGYATEAVRATVAFAFNDLDLRDVTATCHADNARSRRVLAHVGFELASTGSNGIDLFRIAADLPQPVGQSA